MLPALGCKSGGRCKQDSTAIKVANFSETILFHAQDCIGFQR